MDVYVDYSGASAHAWAATLQLRNGHILRVGGALPPQQPGTIWRGEEQAYLACRAFLAGRTASYHNDDATTCRRLGLIYVHRTHPLHRQAHTLARRIRTSLEAPSTPIPKAKPPHTVPPPDPYDPIRARWNGLPKKNRRLAEKRLRTLLDQAQPPKKPRGQSTVQQQQFHQRAQLQDSACRELAALTPKNAREWAVNLSLKRQANRRKSRVKGRKKQPKLRPATPSYVVYPQLTSPWQFEGAIPAQGIPAVPVPMFTPTGLPRNTIRERLLRVLTPEPQLLQRLVPPISRCSPATAIAAALQLHSDGLAIVQLGPSRTLTIASIKQDA